MLFTPQQSRNWNSDSSRAGNLSLVSLLVSRCSRPSSAPRCCAYRGPGACRRGQGAQCCKQAAGLHAGICANHGDPNFPRLLVPGAGPTSTQSPGSTRCGQPRLPGEGFEPGRLLWEASTAAVSEPGHLLTLRFHHG